jgi:hypothetical protein
MKRSLQIGAGLLVIGLSGTFALLVARGPADGTPLIVTTPLRTEDRRLSEASEQLGRRRRVQEELIAALAEGRIPLAEAAAQFLTFFESEPRFLEAHQRRYPAATLREGVARGVAERAYQSVSDPARRAQLVARLSEEFGSLFPGRDPLQFEPTPAPEAPVALPVPRRTAPRPGRFLPSPGDSRARAWGGASRLAGKWL